MYRNKEYILHIPQGVTFTQGTQIGEMFIVEPSNPTHTTEVKGGTRS